MKKQIIIPYFPKGMKYSSPVAIAAGIYLLLTEHYVWAPFLFVLAGVILTTRYVTEIDLSDKTFRDYLSLLGIPLNVEAKHFKMADRIVITKRNHAQMVNTKVQSRRMDWSDYTGTLILDNDKVDLLTRNSKNDLLLGLKDFAIFLKVGVEDRTTNYYYWVDLSKV